VAIIRGSGRAAAARGGGAVLGVIRHAGRLNYVRYTRIQGGVKWEVSTRADLSDFQITHIDHTLPVYNTGTAVPTTDGIAV
jgi:hypothetical protein